MKESRQKQATLLLKVSDSIKQLVRDNRFNVVNKRIHTEERKKTAVIYIYYYIIYYINIIYYYIQLYIYIR